MRYIVLVAFTLACGALNAGSSASNPPQTTKPAPKEKMADQVDQTDIYAIPLDSSESEQEQEYKDLQKQK
jgi:hypothetical protein